MHDLYFWGALKATSIFVLFSVPVVIVTALAFAVGIEAIPGKRQSVYQLAVFLPTMITISVAGILWRWFFNAEFGLFNAVGAKLHVDKIPWLLTPHWAMTSIILMTLWWTVSGPTVILIAGLKANSQFLLRSGRDRRGDRLATLLADHAAAASAGAAVCDGDQRHRRVPDFWATFHGSPKAGRSFRRG